jgi:hypothetical protein
MTGDAPENRSVDNLPPPMIHCSSFTVFFRPLTRRTKVVSMPPLWAGMMPDEGLFKP